MSAGIGGDHAMSGVEQRGHDPRRDPVGFGVGHEAVVEHDRRR
jgi:hypothetical protein